jgi:putative membrane protein
MRKIMFSGLMVAALCFASGCNSGQQNKDSVETAEQSNENKEEATKEAADDTKDDSEFAVKAANGGMMEVELARLASTKATSTPVKEFAKKMMDDHMKANDELQSIATQKNITLPAALSEESQKDVDRLSKLSGTEFDKEYMSFMVDDHQEDVDEFKKASDECKDPELKAFAAKTLPVLQSHLDMAKQTKETVDKMGKQSSSR